MKTSSWQHHTQKQCWVLGDSYIVLLLVQTDQRQWSATQPVLDASGWIQETAQPANSGPYRACTSIFRVLCFEDSLGCP